MAFRVWTTDIVSEKFSNLPVFNDKTTSYADLLAGYSGLRAPSQMEFNKIFEALNQGYLDGAFSEANFLAKNYNIHVYVYDGQVGFAAAHNSSTNAINAGAPKNSIWIGFDTLDLNIRKDLLAAYASHEVLHSSPNIDRQAARWAKDFSHAEVAKMAKALGVDENAMRSLLARVC